MFEYSSHSFATATNVLVRVGLGLRNSNTCVVLGQVAKDFVL